MAIKAIAMDIDGTLTNDQKVISPRTRESCSRRRSRALSSSWLRVVPHGGYMLWHRSLTSKTMTVC